MKLSQNIRCAIRHFVFYLHNGTIDFEVMGDHDYRSDMMDEASLMEAAYSVFLNNLEIDEEGIVLNFEHAKKRAAHYLKSVTDSSYEPNPKFEDWEVELHSWT